MYISKSALFVWQKTIDEKIESRNKKLILFISKFFITQIVLKHINLIIIKKQG
jgi:hypothetical protein